MVFHVRKFALVHPAALVRAVVPAVARGALVRHSAFPAHFEVETVSHNYALGLGTQWLSMRCSSVRNRGG